MVTRALALLGALVALAATLVFAAAGPAAATTFDDVGQALRNDPVYQDPKAEVQLTSAEQDQVRAAIRSANTPIYVAILPKAALSSVGGDPNTVLDRMRNSTGRSGTYAVVIGTSDSAYGLQARSTLGSVSEVASQAYYDNKTSPTGALVQLANGVGDLAAAGKLNGSGSSSGSSGGGGSAVGLLAVLGVVGAGAVGLFGFARHKAKKRNVEATDAVRKTLDEDITAFGEALDDLDVDLSDPRLGEEGRADLGAALDKYDQAKRAAVAMQRPEDAANVTEALDEGRWRVACVKARLAGEALPERRPPCFFDPRHGLSVKDVPFAPSGGATRDVPACQACAVAVESGTMPNARMVPTGAGDRPYWDSGREYAGYTSGYYRNNTDLFSTIFMATMIGNMFSGPHYYGGGGGYDNSGGNAGGGWGGGDSGGGGGGWFDGGGGGGWGGGGGDFGGGGGGW